MLLVGVAIWPLLATFERHLKPGDEIWRNPLKDAAREPLGGKCGPPPSTPRPQPASSTRLSLSSRLYLSIPSLIPTASPSSQLTLQRGLAWRFHRNSCDTFFSGEHEIASLSPPLSLYASLHPSLFSFSLLFSRLKPRWVLVIE